MLNIDKMWNKGKILGLEGPERQCSEVCLAYNWVKFSSEHPIRSPKQHQMWHPVKEAKQNKKKKHNKSWGPKEQHRGLEHKHMVTSSNCLMRRAQFWQLYCLWSLLPQGISGCTYSQECVCTTKESGAQEAPQPEKGASARGKNGGRDSKCCEQLFTTWLFHFSGKTNGLTILLGVISPM